MVHLKIASLTLLAALATCEPPVQGYNYNQPTYRPGFNTQINSYLPPSTGYNPPSNNYLPPTPFGSGHSGSGHSGSPGYVNSGSPGYGNSGSHGYENSGSGNSGSGHDHGHGHENEVPKSYEFGYSVKDAQSGNDYGRRESSDGNVVRGEYRVQLPDGRTQIVTYYADWQTGFHADVKYEGEAKYPEPVPHHNGNQGGYNYNAPSGYSGSLTGFHGNSNRQPSTAYGAPGYH